MGKEMEQVRGAQRTGETTGEMDQGKQHLYENAVMKLIRKEEKEGGKKENREGGKDEWREGGRETGGKL